MASKLPRGARYWLKENSMDHFFPRLSKEKWEERKSMWQIGDVAGILICAPIAAQSILSYFWPQYFDVNIPFVNFSGYEYFPRVLYRTVDVKGRDESDK